MNRSPRRSITMPCSCSTIGWRPNGRKRPIRRSRSTPNRRLRLRLINATGTAAMALRVEQHRTTLVAIDGQPAEPFAPRDSRVARGPGNRVDLLADMTLAPGATSALTLITAQGERTIGRFVYDAGPAARAAPLPDPQPLPANPLPSRI